MSCAERLRMVIRTKICNRCLDPSYVHRHRGSVHKDCRAQKDEKRFKCNNRGCRLHYLLCEQHKDENSDRLEKNADFWSEKGVTFSHSVSILSSSSSSPSSSASKSNTVTVNGAKIGEAILPIQIVNVENSVKAQVMFDNCSQNSFILEDFAKQLKLNGTPISFILVTTDGQRTQKSGNLYQIRLKDKENNVHQIDVIGD